MDQPADYPAIAVLGPTGSGKSELALHLAERYGGEIVNCDSLQVYRGFNIGTAKLTLAERRGVPHHLIDIIGPEEVFTAGDYACLGRTVLRDIAVRGNVPILCGGTGFYLRALLDGLSPSPGRDEDLRANLLAREVRRPGALHRLLRRLDPVAGLRIHANDSNKVLRALELRLLRNEPHETLPPPDRLTGFSILKLGLQPDRAALYLRLNARLDQMFETGLLEEVRGLLARGVSPLAKPFESLGYKQALAYLEGRITLPQAIEEAQQATRHYAKRQVTWFRRVVGMHWIPSFGSEVVSDSGTLNFINEHLKNTAIIF